MMPDSHEPHLALLDRVTVALFRGDWRTAMQLLFEGGDLGNHPELLAVAYGLSCVTRNLRFQSVTGDVGAAWRQLTAAARRLAEGAPVRVGVEPHRHLRLTHLRWDTMRLVERDRADLTALRLIVERLPRGRRELVYAAIEFLTFVDHDPWTVQVHPRDRELTGLDDDAYARWRTGNRQDICARATHLRQFADVRSGSVNVRTWHRMGGYAAVREQALRMLAAEPVTRGTRDLPVRLGRQRAWKYACDWMRDTVA